VATQNAIDTNKPIGADDGGTGAATLLDHGVLVGSGTSPITAISVGTIGELLVGSTTSDPSFGSSADGDFSFTSSTLNVTRTVTVQNTDNTAAAVSGARFDIIVGGGNVGDPQIKWTVTGSTSFSLGIDNDDSDNLKISASATLGSTDAFTCTDSGEIRKPLQPAFLATPSGNYINVTGDGTVYTVVNDSEIFDQTSDYNTGTGQFTAAVTGRYYFTWEVYVSGSGSGTNRIEVTLNSSNRDYTTGNARTAGTGDMLGQMVAFTDMDSGDLIVPQVAVFGNASAQGDVLGALTRFAGFLVC
jgi:hypothetical protein